MWNDWAEGIHRLDCLITVKIVADQMRIEFGSDDGEDGDDDEEADRVEEGLVLAFRSEDKYPLLPAVNSNTPLDLLKRVLRVYVREVQSKFQ